MSTHCCDAMAQQVSRHCADHTDAFQCPDSLVDYYAKFDEYGIIIHDGGTSVIGITYCPWCGSKLPESKRDRWFEELEKLGFSAPLTQDIPEQFKTNAWYRT